MKPQQNTEAAGVTPCSPFFICAETLPPENVRAIFFIMPYRCWAFGKMIGKEICLPTSPANAKAIYWAALPLVPESMDSARKALIESIK